jgi:hypothetical protein
MKAAFCSSQRCDKIQTSAKGTVKNVPIGTKSCPDCGHILVWHEANSKYRPGINFNGRYHALRKQKIALGME